MSALERNCILYITHYKFCISHPKNLTVIDLSNNFISQEFPKALYSCSSSKTLTSHRITSTAQSRWTFTACLACAASTLEPTASLVTFHHLLDSQTTSFPKNFLKLTTIVPSSKTLTSHRITPPAQSWLTFTNFLVGSQLECLPGGWYLRLVITSLLAQFLGN